MTLFSFPSVPYPTGMKFARQKCPPVTTYSDVKVASKTGTLTIQNRNNFDIVVHLLSEGEQERVSDNIPVGGCHSFLGTTDKEYTVGVHADVNESTEIKVFVYDGEKTDPYINTKP